MTLEYGDKQIRLKPYNTLQEKNLLLYASNPDDILEELRDNYRFISGNEKLTDSEKIVLIWKLREISVGETIAVKYKCQHCSKVQEADLDITGNITEGNLQKNFKGFKITEVFSKDPEEYVDSKERFLLDELETHDYDELIQHIKENSVKFNFIKEDKCIHCQGLNKFDVSTDERILQHVSELDLASIYRIISELVFHGNYSKIDCDSMLPFEREIYIGLLNKQIENKTKK